MGKVCLKRAGIFIGAALFTAAVAAAQSRVLRIDVTGSGAYYREEVRRILSEGGISPLCAMPEDSSAFTAQILSLPRVSFCSLSGRGGVLTVEVQVSDDSALRECAPFTAPSAGKIEELTVVRGQARVSVGDDVNEGDILVDCAEQSEGGLRAVVVIARAKIAKFVRAEYGGDEESARLQAQIEFGELRDISARKSENGYVIEGTAVYLAAMNMR